MLGREAAELRQWMRQPAAWLILLSGALLSLFAWRTLTLEVERAAQTSFNESVAVSRNAIESRLRDSEVILRGVHGLFLSDDRVDRAEFHRYAEGVMPAGAFRYARSVSFARRVSRAEKQAYEAGVRADASIDPKGYPRFAIKPAGERDEYVVVEYIEPFAGNEPGFGLDLLAEPGRRVPIERARDTGELTATAPFTLLSSSRSLAISLRLPVFRVGARLQSNEQRREAFVGILSVTFLVGDMVADVVRNQAANSLHLDLFDVGLVNEPTLPQRLFSSEQAESDGPSFESVTPLEVGRRRWQLRFSAPRSAFVPPADAVMPWFALVGGILISALLAGLVASLKTSSERARRLAEQMTEDLRASEGRLAQSQRRTQELIESLPNPIFFKGRDGVYQGVNKAWEAFFGLARERIIGKTVRELYPHAPQVAERLDAMDQVLWRSPGTQAYETSISTPNGTRYDTIYYKATFTSPEGQVAGLIGTIIDITERKQSERQQAMEHATTRLLAEAKSPDEALPQLLSIVCEALGWRGGVRWRWDEERRTLHAAERWGEAAEGASALAERACMEVQPVFGSDRLALPLLLGAEVLGALELLHGSATPAESLVRTLQSIASQVAQYLVRKKAEEAVLFVATHDSLTALPNRVMFSQRLDHALSQARRHGRKLAVLFIDLDRFKIINDTLGHEAGDGLLREVARRLKHGLRGSDTVARLGGDEFVVLLEEIEDPVQVGAVAQKLLGGLAEPFLIGGRHYHVTASIGASTYPDDAQDAQALLKNADIAMYRAKERGRNTFQYYSAELNVHNMERLAMESDLRRALERDELVLYYQPQVELGTGRIVGVESLVRWQHPTLGLLSPATFIPIAEETGLIVPIGEWILRTACAAQRAWQRQGLPPVRMSINLSARQFLHGELLREIETILGTSGCDPSSIELEVTESMVMSDPERVARVLERLRELKLRVAIDDFGAGASSLSYIKRFPIDTLKIDQSFVAGIEHQRGDRAIVQAVIVLAHTLGMDVVAEGVENQGQENLLLALGCDAFQGYYFSRPVAEAQLRALLRWPANDRRAG
ncbi:MAG TPA: EAL domain-containing protein [Burkholderiales bacterium]|nr:EAL domain-containing protein [Burkholderiales bacterium]